MASWRARLPGTSAGTPPDLKVVGAWFRNPPGVKSMGPSRARVKGRVMVWRMEHRLPSNLLYSLPRTPSCVMKFGYVRARPVGLYAPWKSTSRRCLAASCRAFSHQRTASGLAVDEIDLHARDLRREGGQRAFHAEGVEVGGVRPNEQSDVLRGGVSDQLGRVDAWDGLPEIGRGRFGSGFENSGRSG